MFKGVFWTIAIGAVVTAAGISMSASKASAVVLTLDTTPIVQQTQNSPCVIGDPSCNNPVLFDFTLIPPNTSAATLTSPDYTVDQIVGLVTNQFVVGIDVNQAQDIYNLVSFTVFVNNVAEFTFGGSLLPVVNNGNGFSDYVLKTVDLSPFTGTDIVKFTAVFTNADDGREEYFLAAGQGSPSVPEPATAILLGCGIAGALRWRRQKNRA